MASFNILGISGSLRKSATNSLLIREAARLGQATDFKEADLNVPLYDGDLEEADGIPAMVQTLSDQIAAADAVVISTPEYNKGISGVLKNALDWVSRTDGSPWAGKPAALMSATAGRAGGERAQSNLRLAMAPFRPRIVAGPEVLVSASHEAFDNDGQLKADSYIKFVTELMEAVRAEVELTR